MNHPTAKADQDPSVQPWGECRDIPLTLILLVTTALALGFLMAPPAQAQIDTTVTTARTLPTNHSAKGALRRAAIVPGWGQYYTRQYLKMPLVYLGLGGFTGAALYTNSRYLLYRHAYLFTAREEEGEPVFPEYADDYAKLLNDLGLPPESALSEEERERRRSRLEPQFRAQRDNLRRNRDLLYFGIVFWYGLSMLDAFVSAHLLDFDVGEDLTLRFYPHPTAPGLTATLQWGL